MSWKTLSERLLLILVAFQVFLASDSALAQYYGQGYAAEPEGPTAIQKILTGPAATLIMVLIGAAGLFNLFFSTGKGEKSDKQQLFGIICMVLVIALVAFRCSLWNDPNFQK